MLVLFASGMIAYGTHEFESYLVKNETIDKNNVLESLEYPSAKIFIDNNGNEIFYTYDESKGKYYHLLHDKGNVGVFEGFLWVQQ